MLNEWISELYIARKCVHLASEDAVGIQVFNYSKNVHDWIRDCGTEINSLSRLREKTKKQYKEWIKPIILPKRVFDRYTARWKTALNRGEKIDIRYSWVLHGWIHMRKQFLSKSKLDPDNTELKDAYDADIIQALERWLSYDERMDEVCSK